MVRTHFPNSDPAHDVLRYRHHPLDALFAPKAIAVIGASERPGSVGRTLLWNLIANPFGGTIFPVNPKRASVLGIKAYPTIEAVPEPVDLAVVAIPAPMVPKAIRECVDAGVKGAVIISAGFREIGSSGFELEQQILAEARRGNLRIIGPNCLGIMCPATGLNATFASSMARAGNVAFISQSGAICTATLDWSLHENVGFSAFISIGSMLDVDWGTLIDYLGDDPRTHSIVIYMESIGNARSFLSAAREVALTKPIIAIKAGQTEAAAKASASHTGALAGSNEVLDAAFRRCGVLRVNRISELFNLAEVLAKQDRPPRGPRLTIITNAGGPGVLATDALIATGGELATLSAETIAALDAFLPPHWSRGNPIDILGDADPERYARTLETAIADKNSDGFLAILSPQAMTDPTQTAERIKASARSAGKTVLASWMGGAEVNAGEDLLNRASIPTYRYPDSAARLFSLMWRYTYILRGIYETPVLPRATTGVPSCDRAANLIQDILKSRRTLLTEFESKQLLAAYGIPVVQTKVAPTVDDAIALAEDMGYPVALKLCSETITHKTDVGGVRLNLSNAEAVRGAYRAIIAAVSDRVGAEHVSGVTVQPMLPLEGGYELIVGSSIDPQFGPVLVFGSGGRLVEIYRDRAIALPPLNTTLARRMMEQTQIYRALQGIRGRQPIPLADLEKLLVCFSQLVVEQPRIREIDINPLLATPDGAIALDARIVLHPPELDDSQLPKPAIRPYPTQYASLWQMRDGTPVVIRPIRPEDEPLLVNFHKTLSEESVYFRYFNFMKLNRRIAHERLIRICFIDYDREIALVAERQCSPQSDPEILAVGRLSKLHGLNEAEFALIVSDPFQKQGVGTELLRCLIDVGRAEKLDRISGRVLPENTAMQRACEKVGFALKRADGTVRAEIALAPESPPPG